MEERTVPLFSIGGVSRMVQLSTATIRTWETRYGLIAPQRSRGGQRLYSRDQVEQLRFVKSEVDAGRRPAEAHRLLSERLKRGDSFESARVRVLFAESGLRASAMLEKLFGGDTFEVHFAADPAAAEQAFDELAPAIVFVDDDSDFEELAERIRAAEVIVLPLDLLARPLALLGSARSAAL